MSRQETAGLMAGEVRDIQKPIVILMFLVNGTHKRGSRRKDFVDEDKDRLFRSEFDAFTDNIAELSDC